MAKKDATTMQDLFRSLSEDLKRTATRPNIYGYEPHFKQEKFHSQEKKGRLYIGGNRSGKTTGGVIEDIWWATGRHPYLRTPEAPIRGRVVGVDFLNGISKIILPEFARWIPPSFLKNGSWTDSYKASERTLTFENGSFIEFMSYDQDLDKFAGTSRHFIHYDEEPPQDIWDECNARLIDTGGSWWMTMTPVEGMTWVYDKVYLPGSTDPTSRYGVVEVDMQENPHLSPQEVEAYLSGLSEDDRLARGKGKFIQVGGLVYKTFSPERHVIDPIIPPKDWEWYASVDHGFNNPTAWLWHAVSPNGRVVTFAEHYESEMTVDKHAQVVHLRNAGFGRIPDVYVGDPAISQRNGVTGDSIQTEYAKYDIPVALGNNDVLQGINKINTYLNNNIGDTPGWVITRNCVNLIREMQRLRWKTWASKKMASQNNKHDAVHKKDDHACDSARYFFTFLPDLSPNSIPAAKHEGGNPLGAISGINPYGEHIDPKLTGIKRVEEPDIWTVQKAPQHYIDPYMGGEW